MVVEKLVPEELDFLVPAGTYFVCGNKAAQNMVATKDVQRKLRRDSETVYIPSACADQPKNIPTGRDGFTIGALPNEGELQRLMAVVNAQNVPFSTRQAAVWIVTDNATYSGLGSLVGGGGSRAIGVADAARAMQLCVESGINVKAKNIWRDRDFLLKNLSEGDLKRWLEGY